MTTRSKRTCKHGLKACDKCRLDLVDRKASDALRDALAAPLPADLLALVVKAVRA